MKRNTSDLIDSSLDWAVAKAEEYTDTEILVGKMTAKRIVVDEYGIPFDMRFGKPYNPSTNWAQGGPIIEREGIDLVKMHGKGWHAEAKRIAHGPTPLIAAMRCYVTSRLGDEVDIPKELAT